MAAAAAERAAKQTFSAGLSRLGEVLFEYDTQKIVHIKSKKVGLINRFIQLAVIAYIIGYVIVYKKGYQETENIESATSAKVKGVIYVNISNVSDSDTQIGHLNRRIYDVADYAVPPQESDAFFVMTNLIITPNQTQSICPEDAGMLNVNCTKDSDCPFGERVINGNGVRDGTCNKNTNTCNVYAWCPVENSTLPAILNKRAVLWQSKRFTVLIKNQIEFPKFHVKRRNIFTTINDKGYLRNCTYNSDSQVDKYCPIFELETIAKSSGFEYEKLAIKGAVIAININWDCNLDYSIEKCFPDYKFRRLDSENVSISEGMNFRFANYYLENGKESRDLIKAFGIRFLIKVTGKAGKFSIVPLLLNIGSGIGLLGIATVLCDILLVHCLKRGYLYYDKKYFIVAHEEEELVRGLKDPTDASGGGASGSSNPDENISSTRNTKNDNVRPRSTNAYERLTD